MKKYLDYLTYSSVFPKVNTTSVCQRVAWVFSIVAVSSVAGFNIPLLPSLYLPVCLFCLLYILGCGNIKIDKLYLFMYIVFGISAFLASEPFFKSQVRYLLFVCVSLLCTSCISSPMAIAFRCLVYRNLLLLLSFLTIGSFVGYFMGINLMRSYDPNIVFDVSSAGLFGGIYAHSMLLGPLSVCVALYFLNVYLDCRKYIFIFLFFAAVAAVVMSASRGAIVALVVPIIYLLFFMKDLGETRKKLIGLLFIASIIAIPTVDRIASGLLEKQNNNERAGSTFSSRESKWDNRIEEFQNNPMFGIGFCAVDIEHSDDYNEFGGVEPGSTHLSILSMTGIIGAIPYFIILVLAYKNVRQKNDIVAQMRMAIFLAMITHAIVEGYALYAGGLLCFVYWLSIGLCMDYKKTFKRS